MRILIAFLLIYSSVQCGELEECLAISKKYGLLNEVVLPDRSRVDLMSDQFAIEVDWSDKWAEGIGQALFYGVKTSRKPGVLLIKRTSCSVELHQVYVLRCITVCEKYGVVLWTADEGSPVVTRSYPADPFQ